jgi:Ca2+-binding EF-hand superfamily protein/serine/threonine protein kinase
MDADPTTGQQSLLRTLNPVDEKSLVTFQGFVDVLMSFESRPKNKILKRLLDFLKVYDWRLDTVDFFKFLREVTRYSAKKWDLVLGRTTNNRFDAENVDKNKVARFIQGKAKLFIERLRKPPTTAEKAHRERNNEVDLKVYEPKEMIDMLQAEYKLAGIDLNLQVERAIKNYGEQVSQDKFRDIIYNQFKFVGLSRGFIEQLFKKLDPKRSDRAPLKPVMALVFSDNKESLLMLPESGEELMNLVSEAAHIHYDSGAKFTAACRHEDPTRINLNDFDIFCTSFTRLSKKHTSILFSYLDEARRNSLTEGQILNLWEHKIKMDKAREAAALLDKSRDDDKMKSFNDISGFGQPGADGPIPFGFGNRQGSLLDPGMGDEPIVLGEENMQELTNAANNQSKSVQDELEELVMKISLCCLEMIRYHGKNLKDIFHMFADKVTKMMNFDEFSEMAKFLTKDKDMDENMMRRLYLLMALPQSKKLSYTRFLSIVEMGKKINSLYIKLKRRYGDKIKEVRPIFVDELNKMNVTKADGYVPLNDVRRLFGSLKVEIQELDQEMLKEDGILVQRDKTNVLNLVQFINKVFQDVSEFGKYVMMKSARKIYNRFKKYKKLKLEKKAGDELLFKLIGGDSQLGKDKAKMSPKQKSKVTSKKIKLPKTAEEKMVAILPDANAKKQPMTVHEQKIYSIAEKILNNILEDVVINGERNLLRKNVQRRFANRSVNKDSIVMIQEEAFSVSNIIPRSVSSIPSIGRIFYMDSDAILNQYDLTNSSMLPTVDLASKMPMKKDEILDYLLDSESGLLYILKMSWIIECWNIFQKSKSPASKIKVLQTNEGVNTINLLFKNRHLGAFPSFLSLSQNSRQYLVVNCTMINGNIYFLDPISLSVLNQTRIKNDELSISPQLNKIFYQLKPLLTSLAQQQMTFDKIFAGDTKIEDGKKNISTQRFRKYLLEDINSKPVTESEVNDLISFLDINGDDTIDEDEWLFLCENVRLTTKKTNVHASYEIPEELRNLDRGVAKIFYDIGDFISKKNVSIVEMFKIFDNNDSGSISEVEFLEILAEICKDSTLENKRKFFKFLDKDNSRTIEIDEFLRIFKMFGKYSPQELLPSESPRLDFFVIVEKSFEHGIDIESEFTKLDQYKDGGVEPYKFRLIMKNLPFGLTDQDVDNYIEKEVPFTNDGNINYLGIFGHERYKRIKYIYQMKKGLREAESKLKDSEDLQRYLGQQKVVIESLIHLSAEDVFLFTTISPKTSTIYMARTQPDDGKRLLAERFDSQILARLLGHTSREPPTILYVNESGCLISGEKLSPIKEAGGNIGQPENRGGDAFSRFYSNVTSNKTRVANIMVWNLSRDLFTTTLVDPPFKINPTRIIENAHYDSILCLAYMPLAQIIVSTSNDGSIKLWDPVARPHSLVHKEASQKVKAGYYTSATEEVTVSNQGFSEVGRFYTGDLTCYSLICQHQRIPVSENDGVPKFRNLEYLISMELGKAQRSAGKLKTEGLIKIFGVERITMEVPVSRFEEPIPKQLWTELVDLAISNRQSTKYLFKRNLATSLDKIMSKVVIQKTELAKIAQLLKGITLERFVDQANPKKVLELFNLLVHLPLRNADSHPKLLSIDEVHMHLKRHNYLFPSNISKDAFVSLAQDLIRKSSHYLVDHRSKNQNKFLNVLSQKISKKEIDIDKFFNKEIYTRIELKRLLEEFSDNEDDIEELLTELDPFYSNNIKLDALKTFFSSEIISAKITEFARPNVIISQINAKLSRSNKVDLLRNLFGADPQGTGRINKYGFLQAFARLSRPIDENLLKELFELISDEEGEGEPTLELSYFCKKLLTHSEQFELARVYNALGKIKNSLRFRLKSLEDLFIDEEQEFKGKNVQNLTIKISQFMNKVRELDIVGLNTRDLNLISNFLSTVDEEGNSCISLLNLNAYFKKIEHKYQFTELSDYKILIKELQKIVMNKEEFCRKWAGLCNRELIGFGEMRILLNHFNIREEVIDLILLKFVEQETSSVNFFNRISAFIEMNSFLEDSKNLKPQQAHSLANKLFQDQSKTSVTELGETQTDKPKDSIDDLVELMERHENKKSIQAALAVCKKFDTDNTGRVNIADFVNILWYNLESAKYPEAESVLLAFQNEFIIRNNMKTIEYSEVFDRLESKRASKLTKANTEMNIQDKSEYESSLTKVIAEIGDKMRRNNFNLDKALAFFDRDNLGLIVIEQFRKIIKWTKADLSDQDMIILEDNLLVDNAINYRKFLDLLEINDKHINVQFDPETWYAISKSFSIELFEKLSINLDYLIYFNNTRKTSNPLVSAATLEQRIVECKEFNTSDIENIVKYAIAGSVNSLSGAISKMQNKDIKFEFEYVHLPHFLASVPVVLNRKRELPENKDTNRMTFTSAADESKRSHVVSNVKRMLKERGVTMWESIFSCSSSLVDGSKITKHNFLRILKTIDLNLTMKEKVLLINHLDPTETGKIELNTILSTFEPGGASDEKVVQDSILLQKFIYGIYYGGHNLSSVFDMIDENKSGMVSVKDFVHGLSKLDLPLIVFERDRIRELLDMKDQFSFTTKAEFTKKLKRLMKKYNINPTKNFSFSLFAKIKNLIEKKNRNLLECFVEEDLHRSGFADLEMLKRALVKFGLTNIKIHEIKLLVKLFKADVNAGEMEDSELEEEEEEENKDQTLDLIIDEKPKKKEEKEKKFDVADPNFRIDYNDFVRMIYDEVENNSQTMIRGAYLTFRKIYNIARSKDFSIFDTFVYFDVNNQNKISNMQLRIGLQNLNIALDSQEIERIWSILEKDKESNVSYASFFNAFLNAGCLDIIKFDEKITKLLKNFCFLASKKGNLEEVFNKFDPQQNGTVKLDQFKQQCEKLQLDFKEEELVEIFRVLCNPEELNPQLKRKNKDQNQSSVNKDSRDDSQAEETKNSYRAFNFKSFVLVFGFFRKKEHLLKLLHKFDAIVKEKGLSYQKIFEDYFLSLGKDKKRTPGMAAPVVKSKGIKGGNAKPDPNSITMTDLKTLIRNLKVSFTSDELNLLCDAFEVETINAKQMESIVKNAVDAIEKDKSDKSHLFQRIAKEIEDAIQQKNSSLQKIFFEFDGRSDGSLTLSELNEMLAFLKIRVNKTEVKVLFEEIDYDKKGTITIKEFQSFFDQAFYHKHNEKEAPLDPEAKISPLEPIIKKLQKCAGDKQTNLERVIQSLNVDMNQIVSMKGLEKALLKMDCVLKRDEVKLVIEAASKEDSCSWADLIDWGIKNNVDFRAKEKGFSQFPPAVQVILSKILQIFKKLNLSIETAFKYFTRDFGDKSMRNEFLTFIQGLQVPTNEEELIGLYNFFDERNYGEISRAAFIEKCEIARDFYKWSDNSAGTVDEKKGLITLTLRQHVISILEKIYLSFQEKNFNKKQIFAVFDKHGNGMITRDEFMKICDNLGMPIDTDYQTSVINFLDPGETQIISITSLLKKMEDAVPDHAKDTLKSSQAQAILRDIVSKLKVHIKKLLVEYLDLEKKLQVNDLLARIKTGVPIFDFYKLLASYGIRLQEGDKMILNAAFKNKKVPDYFDTESLYLTLDKLSGEAGFINDIETENLEGWESSILRRVADKLRSMNLTLEKAFKNNLGFIKIVDFKQLLFSLDINLSQKDVDLLISRLATASNPNVISLEEFKQRFWACFFEGKAQPNQLNADNRSRQTAAMLLSRIKFELKLPLSYAWDKLDRKKNGYALIEDLKDFLLEIKMPITKEDLGLLFTLIDQTQDSMIDQYEFVEFWNQGTTMDFETKKKKQKRFETDILGQIAKKLNQTEKDLATLFKQQQTSRSDTLDERQLNIVLGQIGLNFNEGTVREIMKLANNGVSDRISFNHFETALMRNGFKPRDRKNEVKIEISDSLITSFLSALNVTANKQKVEVPLLVRDFDEDYDGFLSTQEFYNLIRSLEKPFKMDEIQRLAHLFASSTSPNKIVIDSIIQAQSKQEKIESNLFENLCDADAFKAVLENFDPTIILFRRWGKLKQAKIRFEKFLQSNKDSLRGLRLLSVQFKLKQVEENMDLITQNIRLLMQSLKNNSTQLIRDETLVKWIDPAHCVMTLNKKELQSIVAKQDGCIIPEYTSSQQFNIKYDTQRKLNRVVSVYNSDIVGERGVPSNVRIYTAETLRRISKDGKFFEDHLLYTVKLQTILWQDYPEMFVRIYGIYSRKVGMDPKDRDLYVFYEVLSPEWVSLREFISSTGGFVRVPFLVTSNSIFHVIKFWFQKILTIVDVCNQNGCCLYLLRPENIYVNHKTLEVKLLTLAGAARMDHEGTLSYLSDLSLVLPDTHFKPDELNSFRDDQYMSDPYLAPEFFYADITERTPYIDSWTLGAILYFLIFGEDPASVWATMSKDEESRTTKEPSDYYCYDIFPEKLVNEILQYDFGITPDTTNSLIARSIRVKSFEGVFSKISQKYNPHVDPSQDINSAYSLGSFLDIIQLLMAWRPHERPTARALLYSKLFKSDKYQEMQMRQFSSLSFFYRSPSKCVRGDILLPLRACCATMINKPNKILGLTQELMNLIERVLGCTANMESPVFQNLSEEFSKGRKPLPKELTGTALMDSITLNIRESEGRRLKLPNYTLIKFIFENSILDLLLFAVLRHHSAANEALALDLIPAQNLEEQYYKPVKGFSAIMKRLVFDLNSYDTASAPYVSTIIDLLVKFTVGEEFCLASDIVDLLEKDANITIVSNTLAEYQELAQKSTLL